jgi:alpha-L-fucosidase
MKRRTLLKHLGLSVPAFIFARQVGASVFLAEMTDEEIAKGPFQPDWQSLKQYKAPDWYRDAKFGIWAHWGPQCQPEAGDWYARGM